MLKPGLIGLVALLLAAAAPLIQGDPIPDRDIVLEEDPGNLTVSGTTDRSGGVLLSAQPGRYALKLPNAQTLRVPAVARIEVGRTVLMSGTIQPAGRGDVYFLNREGQRLTFMVPRGGRVRVMLTEGAPAGGGGGSTRNMPVYNPDGSIVHPEVQVGPGGPLPDRPAQADRDFDGLRLRSGTTNQSGLPPPLPAQSAPISVEGLGESENLASPEDRAGLRISSDVATIRVQPGLAAAPPTVSPEQ